MDRAPSFAPAALLAPFLPPPGPWRGLPRDTVAVACSGGADSTALTLLLRDVCATRNVGLIALIIDHRLRRDSAAEATLTQSRLRTAGINAEILIRTGAPPTANLQAAARRARFRLLLDWCRTRGVRDLFLAHHLEDQAETVLLRLARGSGVDGLAAMRPIEEREGVRLLRPLLDTPRRCLVATLTAAGMAHIEDPSNQNLAFARVQWRRLLPALTAAGLSPARLAATARHQHRARQALEQTAAAALDRAGGAHQDGYARLDIGILTAAPEDILLRVLAAMVRYASGRIYPPRFSQLQRLRTLVVGAATQGGLTLAGAQAERRGAILWIGREPAAIQALPLVSAGIVAWDNRFCIECTAEAAGASVGPLGAEGWQQVRTTAAGTALVTLPAFIRRAFPTLRRGEHHLTLLHPTSTARRDHHGIQSVQVAHKPFQALDRALS